MLPLMEMNFIESNPIPVKTALSMMGKIELNFRLPLVPMATLHEARLFDLLSKMNLVEGR
jgi:4-hydroxy-tetrahydrodipicolinate synthase